MNNNFNSLNDIPSLGFGTFRLGKGGRTQCVIEQALACGYRHIDCAPVYGNEAEVGRAVEASGIRRGEMFLTTKVPEHLRSELEVWKSIERSMNDLQTQYLDMCLIHWPNAQNRDLIWRILLKAKEIGLIKNVGVSNFLVTHLESLELWPSSKPFANQFELSPFCFNESLTRFCDKNSIKVVAYCLLSRGERLKDARILRIASEHQITSAQVLIRWAYQHGWASVVTSSDLLHVKDNLTITSFELSALQMRILDSLNENHHLCWNPEDVL